MAMKLYSDTDIQDIADAIRSVNGESTTYKVSEMAAEILKFTYTPPNTNIVPTATDPNDSTAIFDDVGYRNNVYYGYNTTAATAASGYVSTGLIAVDAEDIPNITAFYIRGASLDSTEKCKMQVFKAGSRYASYDYSGADSWADHAGSVPWVSSVEELDDDYWRINIDKSKSTSIASVDRQIRFCVKGVGDVLFISINNPIRDAQYDAWINS